VTRPDSATPIDDQSLGELVTTVTRDLSALVRKEIELAKVEITAEAKKAGVGAGFLGGAGFLSLFALIFASIAGAYGISEGAGLDLWIGFICIAGFYALIAGGLAVMGLGALVTIKPPARTIRTVKDDIAWAKHPTVSPDRELEELKASHR
jgi:hypothetical protein